MSQEIIDYYRKANDEKKGSKTVIKQLAEQKNSEIPQKPSNNNEPFQSFVLQLAEKIQKDKQRQETIIEAVTNIFSVSATPVIESASEPIIIPAEEKLKKAAALLIKELKNNKPELKEPEVSEEIAEPEEEKQEEETTLAENPKEEPESKSEEDNSYVKELQSQENKQQKPKNTDPKQTLTQQIHEEFQKFLQAHPNFGMSGSGGGTNAVQYANGGVMRGDLNVTGKYLSGGRDLSELFTQTIAPTASASDRLISGLYELVLGTDGILYGPSNTVQITNLNTINQILSAGVDLYDLFATKVDISVIDGGTFS